MLKSRKKRRKHPGLAAIFSDRRPAVMLLLGFAAGLPNLLIFDTLSAWLRDVGLSLEVIGFFSLATLAYSFKFLWAPLIDRTRVPVLTKLFGHRRSWMLVAQGFIIFGLWSIAGVNPANHLGLMALFAVWVGFASATQDIVIDAWRIESAEIERQGIMAAAYQWGYRLAIITAGAVPLLLAESRGWNFSYAAMACLMGIGVLAVLAAPREKKHTIRTVHTEKIPHRPLIEGPELLLRALLFVAGALFVGSGISGNSTVLVYFVPQIAASWSSDIGIYVQFASVVLGGVLLYLSAKPLPGIRTRPGAYLGAALGEPLRDFFHRYGREAGFILALICLYRLSDFVLNIMNPFYLDLGFTKTQIAEVRKVFGVGMSLLGVLSGGIAIARLGLMRSLLIGAFAGPISNLVFAWLATKGASIAALFIAIGIDNIASGFSGTCLIAYMSSLTASGFTATQYALFSSLYSLPGKLLASQSGRLVEAAAASAQSGGWMALLKPLFAALPAAAFAEAAAHSAVAPSALGAGYMAFFIYSSLLGAFAVALTFLIAGRHRLAE